MGKLMKKYSLVLLAGLALVEVAHAAATKFTDLAVTGNETVTGNLTVSGTSSLATTAFTGPILPFPRTLAQINALTSGTTGQMVVVSDGVMTKICVSSGTTAAGQWTVTQATAAAPTAPLHCQ